MSSSTILKRSVELREGFLTMKKHFNWNQYPNQYWHCMVAVQGQKKDREKTILNDADINTIREQIVEPWHSGRAFNVNGKIIRDKNAVEEIKIVQTDQSVKVYADLHNKNMEASGIIDLATDHRALPFAKGQDLTHELLFSTLGFESVQNSSSGSVGSIKALHIEIYSKCHDLFERGHYPEAVEKGFKVVRDRLRKLTGYETGSEAFGKGKLHIKGASAPNVDEDFNEGAKFLAMAVDRFRNEKSHTSDSKIDDPNRAYEYLVLSSLAMNLLESAEIRKI